MIPVKLIDVYHDQNAEMQIILYDEAGHRALAMWMGVTEATTIVIQLLAIESARPLSNVFAARIVKAAGATLESVEITAVTNDLYYATANLRSGDQVHQIDARPSDALALALHLDAPIFVAEEVMQKRAITIPPDHKPTAKGLAIIGDAFKNRTPTPPKSDAS